MFGYLEQVPGGSPKHSDGVPFMQRDCDGRNAVAARCEHGAGAQCVPTFDSAVDRSTAEPLVHRHRCATLHIHHIRQHNVTSAYSLGETTATLQPYRAQVSRKFDENAKAQLWDVHNFIYFFPEFIANQINIIMQLPRAYLPLTGSNIHFTVFAELLFSRLLFSFLSFLYTFVFYSFFNFFQPLLLVNKCCIIIVHDYKRIMALKSSELGNIFYINIKLIGVNFSLM